jgi:hypothetical protein
MFVIPLGWLLGAGGLPLSPAAAPAPFTIGMLALVLLGATALAGIIVEWRADRAPATPTPARRKHAARPRTRGHGSVGAIWAGTHR